MKIGDFILYEATHQSTKVKRLGRVRWVGDSRYWADATWLWTDESFDQLINNSSTVMQKYCVVITKEVADIFIQSNQK